MFNRKKQGIRCFLSAQNKNTHDICQFISIWSSHPLNQLYYIILVLTSFVSCMCVRTSKTLRVFTFHWDSPKTRAGYNCFATLHVCSGFPYLVQSYFVRYLWGPWLQCQHKMFPLRKRNRTIYSQFLELGQGLYCFGKNHQVVEVKISAMRKRVAQEVSCVSWILK